MQLTRHKTQQGHRWAAGAYWLADSFDLRSLLKVRRPAMKDFIEQARTSEPVEGPVLAPIEDTQEVWASGVTYLRSREARQEESSMASVYDLVYSAQRPELFFKANGWRVVGPDQPVRFRADSPWNVPEPELTVIFNQFGEVIGYTAGNDMSSRSIEGENPLYLPQAKIYDASCALGPAIQLLDGQNLHDLSIEILIAREGRQVFHGNTSTAMMNRNVEDLAAYLFRELRFPEGVFLLTGTGIVPSETFNLAVGDQITITVGNLTLRNPVGKSSI